MPWARVEGSFHSHPKTLRLKQLLGAAHTPKPRESATQARQGTAATRRSSQDGEFAEAAARWNANHPTEWPRTPGVCPACGHNGCFHSLPEEPNRWYCFSSEHAADSGGCGQLGEKGWWGDALDLEAHRLRVRRAEVLRTAGYLEPSPLPGRKGSATLPNIRITTDMTAVVDDAERAILARKVTNVFQRGNVLVRVISDGSKRVRWLTRPQGAPLITPVTEANLRELMAQSARWFKQTARAGRETEALPPLWAVRALADRGEWGFCYLDAVIQTPTMRPDGSILAKAGYDPTTGILYDSGSAVFPDVPENPTQEDARQALEILKEPFAEFPFLDESDRSVPIAAIMSLLARPAIRGPVPGFAYRASTPGSGKGLLADLVAVIGTGRACPRMTATNDDNEMRKRILAIALEGVLCVLLDNVEGAIGSPSLSAALTAEEFSDRMLGFNRTAKPPLRAVWMMTGNNIVFKGDLGRRVIPCDIDAGMEHPEDRTDFVHQDLLEHVRRRRARLVSAALTMLRAFHVAGRPKHDKPLKGSFEVWDRLVRAALIWARAADPLVGCQRIRAEGDSELDALRQGMEAWQFAFGSEPTTAAEAVREAKQRAKDKDSPDLALESGLACLAGCPVGKLDARAIGLALRKYKGRIVSGRRFARKDLMSRRGVVRWYLARQDE